MSIPFLYFTPCFLTPPPEEYDVEIPSEELERLTTVGEVVEYLKDKGAEG